MHATSDLAHETLRLIPLLPLIGAALNGFFGFHLQRRFGERPVGLIAVFASLGAFAVAVAAVARLAGLPVDSRSLVDHVWTLFDVGQYLDMGELHVNLAFHLDPLSAVMVLVVTGVGSLIHIYSMGYMHGDKSYWRFFSYLNLFMFAMLLLVLGDNFIVMFFGWEGVGLCSYLLIGFWYSNRDYAKAGMKAFVVNRVGDFGFLAGLLTLVWGLSDVARQPQEKIRSAHAAVIAAEVRFDAHHGVNAHVKKKTYDAKAITARSMPDHRVVAGSLAFRTLESRKGELEILRQRKLLGLGFLTIVCICFFIGACGKSAQIPLYTWLPDAMAGPTPVSALIHAATMVTAGVYMVARLNFLFALSNGAMTVVTVVGALTALFAATIGFFQYDIKKVLAYSTVSQLGFMFMGVGSGAFAMGIFHLMTHAFFKACLFLGAGSIILGMHHRQDMREMGGIKKYMKATWLTFLVATVTIAGIPPLAGFASKDEILWNLFRNANTIVPGELIWAIAWLTAGCTAFYMFRLYYMTFTGDNRALAASKHAEAHGHGHDAHDAHSDGHHALTEIHESPKTMTIPLMILAGLSLVAGFFQMPFVTHFFDAWMEPVFRGTAHLVQNHKPYGHGIEAGLAIASVAIALVGILVVARRFYKDNASSVPARMLANPRWAAVHRVLHNKYYVDEAYDAAVVRPTVQATEAFARFDLRVIDFLVNMWSPIGRFFAWVHGLADKYVVDGLVDALANGTIAAGRKLKTVQTGRIQNYALGVLVGVVALSLALVAVL
ncbi:MAG: NADH-quinone oxidoreductase subunit L [Deltaproteobacteria bacterium]|nr:NADH-quinone oxidoreductase subunit L [Deltaproteobacteria bacterium]